MIGTVDTDAVFYAKTSSDEEEDASDSRLVDEECLLESGRTNLPLMWVALLIVGLESF